MDHALRSVDISKVMRVVLMKPQDLESQSPSVTAQRTNHEDLLLRIFTNLLPESIIVLMQL